MTLQTIQQFEADIWSGADLQRKARREALADRPRYLRLPPMKAAQPAKLRADRTGGHYGAGVIHGVSLCTKGEALGHDVWLDDTFIASIVDALNEDEFGVKSRFTHPGLSSDGLGKHVGRAMKGTVDGDQAKASLHFTQTSHNTPDGDLATYVMDFADETPEDFAISIVYDVDYAAEHEFMLANGAEVKRDPDGYKWVDYSGYKSPDPLNTQNLPHARLASLRAADFVDDPAANPGGLFNREQDFAQEASELAEFALGLSSAAPATVSLGLDAERVRGFVTRFLNQHNLEVVDMTKQFKTAASTKPNAAKLGKLAALDETATDETIVKVTTITEETHVEKVESTDGETTEPEAEPDTPPTDEPAAEAAPTPAATPQQQSRAEAAKFRKAFGDRGAVWYAEGLTFEEARTRELSELQNEVSQLKQKLSSGGSTSGEQEPVSFDATDKKRTGFAANIRIK